jgi:AcrR family transcriptional regulator
VAGASASQRERRGAGPLTPKGRERRSEILRAARKVFEERGFLDTRVADIVAAAGVAQGTFYSYFDSKEAVFTEVAQQVVETMMEGLHTDFVRDLDPVERIRRAMVRFVEAFRPNGSAWRCASLSSTGRPAASAGCRRTGSPTRRSTR